MKNFQDLTGADLAKIINEKKHVVIMNDQLTTNTVGMEQNRRHQYSIPLLSDEELISVLAVSALVGIEDRKTLWNTFVLIASNLGATISYINTNQVDCQVDVQFI